MPRQRTDLGILLEGVAHLDSAHLLHKQLLEWASYFLGHDEAFCGNATLTGVHQAPLGADRGGHFQIRILEHEIGIAATELEHCLLQHLASLAGDGISKRNSSVPTRLYGAAPVISLFPAGRP